MSLATAWGNKQKALTLSMNSSWRDPVNGSERSLRRGRPAGWPRNHLRPSTPKLFSAVIHDRPVTNYRKNLPDSAANFSFDKESTRVVFGLAAFRCSLTAAFGELTADAVSCLASRFISAIRTFMFSSLLNASKVQCPMSSQSPKSVYASWRRIFCGKTPFVQLHG